MKERFTAGPWEQYAGHVYAPGDKGANVASVSSPRKNELVGYYELRVGDPDIKEAFANADLIAAAPELYKALKAILEHVEDMELERKSNQCTLCHSYRIMGHAALAKAVKQ